MTLGELLAELRTNILHERSDLVAGDPDQLWTDATLVNYIDAAQRRFARRALAIRDNRTPEVTEVTLQTGVTEYVLHQSVLVVVSAKLTDAAADLPRTGHSTLDVYRAPDTQFFDVNQISLTQPGAPLAYTTDETLGEADDASFGSVVLRVYPAPSADYDGTVLRLRVIRMPIERLTPDNLQAVPELPEMHHLEMLDWAAYLALRVVDVDAGWADRAQEFRASFEEHAKDAKLTTRQKVHAPVKWQFGQNGWSW